MRRAGPPADLKGPQRLLIGPREVGRRPAPAAHPDRHRGGAEFPDHGLVQGRRPRAAREHQHGHVVPAGQQGRHPQARDRPADRLGDRLVGGPARPPHGREVVHAVQIVADGGAGVRALLVGAVDQVVHQFPPQPQLHVGQAALMGQLLGEHGTRLVEGESVPPPGTVLGTHQGEGAQHLAAVPGHGDQPLAHPYRPHPTRRLLEEVLVLRRVRFRVRLGSPRTLPGSPRSPRRPSRRRRPSPGASTRPRSTASTCCSPCSNSRRACSRGSVTRRAPTPRP